MRPTRSERLKQEAERLRLLKTSEEQESFLGWAVKKYDLDYAPPLLPQEEAILKDYFPRRWPDLLKVYPSWESLPHMQRMSCVLVIKFGLDPKRFPLSSIPKDDVDMKIQEAIGKKLGVSSGSLLVDPELFKFKR
jgi:hypothetical protein